jgi:hypothetical protein
MLNYSNELSSNSASSSKCYSLIVIGVFRLNDASELLAICSRQEEVIGSIFVLCVLKLEHTLF